MYTFLEFTLCGLAIVSEAVEVKRASLTHRCTYEYTGGGD